MNDLFDTTPFAYVGNNKHYKDLSKEEKDKLKELETKPVEKDALPASSEVEESSASTIGQMLPQVGLTETKEPSSDELFADIDEDAKLLKESLEDEVNGADIYFEAGGFIESIKNKFKKTDVTSQKSINYNKVMKVAKAYTTLRLSSTRVKIALIKDSKVKGTAEYRDLQKKAVNAEKEYRKLKKDLSKDELTALNEYIDGFDSTFDKKVVIFIKDIKESKKAAIKKEYVEYISDDSILNIITESYEYDNDALYTEGANLDIHKRYRADMKIFKAQLKDAKALLKAHNYDDAREKVKEAIKIIEKCKDDTLHEIEKIDDDSVLTAVCGFIFRNITIMCRDILLVLFVYPVAVIRELIDGIQDIMNTITSIKKKGHFSAGDINTYINFVKNDYDRMIRVLKHLLSKIDESEKNYKDLEKHIEKESTSIESECGTSEIVTERDLDPDMTPIIEKLHKKGYQTTASSSGHKNVIIKKDTDRDNVAGGHYYGDARLVFKGKYNLGKAPKYWYWKKVDNSDKVEYLDIVQRSAEESPNTEDKFNKWKSNYMQSLTDWVNSLPDISNEDKKEVEEACKTESTIDIDNQIDMLFESVLGSVELDVIDI